MPGTMDTPGESQRRDATRARGGESGCDGPSLLVVGVDGSDTSWRALYYAFGLARRQGGALVVVYTLAPVVAGFGCPAEVWFAGQEVVTELRAGVESLSAESGVPAEFVTTSRNPAAMLTKLAATRHADAIVIGADSALTHRCFGSKAARTIRRSRCPVTVVP